MSKRSRRLKRQRRMAKKWKTKPVPIVGLASISDLLRGYSGRGGTIRVGGITIPVTSWSIQPELIATSPPTPNPQAANCSFTVELEYIPPPVPLENQLVAFQERLMEQLLCQFELPAGLVFSLDSHYTPPPLYLPGFLYPPGFFGEPTTAAEPTTTSALREMLGGAGDAPSVTYSAEGGWKVRESNN